MTLREVVENKNEEALINVYAIISHWNPELCGEKELFSGQIYEIPWTLIDISVSHFIQNGETLEVYLI